MGDTNPSERWDARRIDDQPDWVAEARKQLEEMGLSPAPWSHPAGEVGLASDPGVQHGLKFVGALTGGAIGDALGRPAEALPRHEVERRYGELRDFLPWSGWQGGPKGTFTDDTQMTICVAECLLAAGGRLDPIDLAHRFVEWLPVGRGKGRATTAAVVRLSEGVPWYMAGERSAGNGAAMRVAPVGLAHLHDLDTLRVDSALSAVVTHADPMAVASAVAQAFLTAWCVHRRPGSLHVESMLAHLGKALEGVDDPGARGTWPGAGPEKVRLVDRLEEAATMVDLAPRDALGRLYNGAFVLESMPAALYCFLRSPEDPEEVIVTAANGGRDADTVAAMAGTLAGAYLGADALPSRWRSDLEDATHISELATQLHQLGCGCS